MRLCYLVEAKHLACFSGLFYCTSTAALLHIFKAGFIHASERGRAGVRMGTFMPDDERNVVTGEAYDRSDQIDRGRVVIPIDPHEMVVNQELMVAADGSLLGRLQPQCLDRDRS